MNKCRWCEEPAPAGKMFCDDMCERLNDDYWAGQGAILRLGDRERAKRDLRSHKNKVRSG
jgi:hypothetical protein